MAERSSVAPQVSISDEQSRKILHEIRVARDKSTRAGQIKEARKKGFTLVGISAAGVIGK